MSAPVLEARDVHKTYRLGRVRVPVLRGASLSVGEGECVAVLGASGSGKSTLLHLLGGLDRPDRNAGEIVYRGEPLSRFDAGALNRYRHRSVGFVFQFYHLLPELNVLENAMIPAMVGASRLQWAKRRREVRGRAAALLDRLGLAHRLRHRPVELSGGERQRVAIARALINAPDVLLADEPTGNLDTATGAKILDAMMEIRAETNQTMVIVTHDSDTAARADRIVRLVDGRVAAEEPAATGA